MSPGDAVQTLMSPASFTDAEHTLAKHTIGKCSLTAYNAALFSANASQVDTEAMKALRRSWRNTEYQKSARRKQAAIGQAVLKHSSDALYENMLDNLTSYGWRTDHNKWLEYGFIAFSFT
jgi:hypothetical protein